ncbi:MAG: sodium:solute symporter family protein, partial [Oscillospiraceae bacterium]|nr:sodium:solute symporter family protein [Oscillospiraceae bacterium]
VFIFLIPYTASLYNGLSRLFGMAFNIDYTVCIVIMAVLTGIYVIAGGYMATAINDFIQGIVMLAGIVAVIFAVLRTNGGFLGSLSALSMVSDEAVSSNPGTFASFFGPDPLNLLGVIILTSLGTWGLPQMVQKFYAIKNENAISKGAIISTIFAIVIAGGCYFVGGFGRIFTTSEAVNAGGFDSIIPTMLSNFSPVLIGLIVILVLSASMSTLSSLVMASSSTLTLDFIRTLTRKEMKDKTQLLLIRILIVFFILISVIIAILQYKVGGNANVKFIAQLMGVSWGALAGSFLAPFFFSLYWKRATKTAVFINFCFGSLLMIANLLFRTSFPALLVSPINCGAFAMLAGFIIVPVVSLLTKAPEKELVDSAFSCYDSKVLVTAKHDLGE